MVRSEDGRLVGFVFVDTDRPIANYVEEARRVVDAQVDLPSGVRIEWAGQFRYFERAKERLMLVVPITLLIVVLLLWWNTRSVIETSIVMLAVPFSLIGAFWLLYRQLPQALFWILPAGLLLCIAVSMVAALWPALQAARIPPAEAVRYE